MVEWGNTSAFGVHFWLAVYSAGSLYANVMDTYYNSHILSSATGLVYADRWQHFALTYDHATGDGAIYLDGNLVASSPLGVFTPQTSYDLYLGYRPWGGGPTYFSGLLDEVSLYSQALSQAQIQAIYSAGSAGKCLGPDILIAPDSQSVAAGANVSFSAAATSTTPMSYQWTLNGSSIAGATNSIYTINNAQSSEGGAYAVVVCNSSGSTTSPNATLAVGSYCVWVSQPMGNCNIP
jgi:hypothetical protein